jgi:hypothetical protein
MIHMDNRALNTFIQRTYHCQPRRMRLGYGLYLVTSVLVCYVSMLAILSQLDNTPNWCRIKAPRKIVLGRPFSVSIKSKNIAETAQVSVSASLRDRSNDYMYRIRPHDPMGKIIGTSQRTFQFALPTDPNIASIQFHAEHQDLPADRSLPIPQSRSRRKPVLSDRIPVHANSLDFPVEQTRGINWGDIFYKALQNGYWREHAGDNTPMGWFITGLYLAGVGICTLCVKRSRQHALSGTWFWWVCVLALLLLGINKQLDLQMLLADLGRTYARSHAWYSLRKPVQIQAVSISLALCLGMVEIILFKLRQAPRPCRKKTHIQSFFSGLVPKQ